MGERRKGVLNVNIPHPPPHPLKITQCGVLSIECDLFFLLLVCGSSHKNVWPLVD